ncbi:MAG: Rieske 2Fe-2S domain-containing protein [Candidatus Marinimicrobia bacterium]|nr:Rieske 2Fe-2S domain-containing protein [Candidatus Neomarinimicrobiota bacterium]MCH7762870.1 Rieske 2Fe-2S domain-containing protein [Candidatus Neomarinimicrobiota bacterium]
MSKDNQKNVSRRDFIWKIGIGSVAVSIGGASVLTVRYMKPNVLFEIPTRFRMGMPEDFSPGSVTTDSKRKVFIIRQKTGAFFAISSVCSHLGCITQYRSIDEKISCPCHGSIFNLSGEVLSGPAPKPLQRVLIEINDRGELIVDTAITVSDDYLLRV